MGLVEDVPLIGRGRRYVNNVIVFLYALSNLFTAKGNNCAAFFKFSIIKTTKTQNVPFHSLLFSLYVCVCLHAHTPLHIKHCFPNLLSCYNRELLHNNHDGFEIYQHRKQESINFHPHILKCIISFLIKTAIAWCLESMVCLH